MTTFNCDIMFGIKTSKGQMIVCLRGKDEIRGAIKWALLAVIGLCLSLASQLLDRVYEPVMLMAIAKEWIEIYAIELVRLICGNYSKAILSWG